MFAIPLLVSTFTLQPYRERHSIIFLEKNYFKQTNSQRVGLLIDPQWVSFFNDPSAGSPTETLLRLLLPLNDQVCPTFQRSNSVARKESQSEGFTKPFNR